MASPNTSLAQMFASHGAHAAAKVGAVTAVAAAQNNTRVATAETRLAALTAAAAAKNNSMVAAEKNKTAAFDAAALVGPTLPRRDGARAYVR